jgi:hypothetical protein
MLHQSDSLQCCLERQEAGPHTAGRRYTDCVKSAFCFWDKNLRKQLEQRKDLFWLTVSRFQVMAAWPHWCESTVRHSIVVERS